MFTPSRRRINAFRRTVQVREKLRFCELILGRIYIACLNKTNMKPWVAGHWTREVKWALEHSESAILMWKFSLPSTLFS